jgi:hypothetical protein
MKRLFFFFLLIFSVSLYARGPRVGGVTCHFENLHLIASFYLEDGFLSPDVLEAVNSTKATTFTYEVEVAKKRTGWFAKTILKKVIEKTVTYDNLTRQYDLVTRIDDEEREKINLTSIDEVREHLGKIENMDIGSVVDLSPGEKIYYVRVRATLLKGFILWIIPSDVDTGWMEKDLKTP